MKLSTATGLLAFCFSFFAHAELMQTSFNLPVDTLDGDPIVLDGRIDRPATPGPWPVVIMSLGSGPSDVDLIMNVPGVPPDVCRNHEGEVVAPQMMCRWRFWEMTAQTLAKQGIAVVRIGKRGVRLAKNGNPRPPNMKQHGTGTVSKRVADVEKLVAYLRETQPELNMDGYYLYGASEGSVISTVYATKHPSEVKGMVFIGAVLDGLEEIFHFQAVTIQWTQLLKQADANKDGTIEKKEFDLTALIQSSGFMGEPIFSHRIKNYLSLGAKISFEYFDQDSDGTLEKDELLKRLDEDLWEPSLKAIKTGDRELFAKVDPDAGVNSFEQVKEWFEMEDTGKLLLTLDIPTSIFFGTRDINTPPAQLDWFLPLAKSLGKDRLFYTELAEDGHAGPNLTAAAAKRIEALGWGRQ